MATKRTVFSAFTVEALLSSDRTSFVREKNSLRQEDEEAPMSAEKESGSVQNFCTGKLFPAFVSLNIYIDILYSTCIPVPISLVHIIFYT